MQRFVARWLPRWFAVAVLATGLLGLWPGPGMTQSGPNVAITQVLTDQFPQVVAYVTVLDASGLAVPGLTEGAFVVQEDGSGVSQFVVSTAREEGIQVILAIDTSGSMRSGRALSDAQAAAKAFLSDLTDRDRAALIVFSESADLVVDFTDDLAALEAAVDGLTAKPLARTALYEAVFEAAERMGHLPPGRKAVVVLTDGADTVGGFGLKDAIDKAQEASVPVYTIGLLGGEFDPAPMRQLAESTKGLYLEAPTSEELTAQFQTVRELLEQQYAIRYTSSLRPDDRPHDLMVEVTVARVTGKDHHPFVPLPLVPWVQFTTPLDGDAVAGSVPVAVDVAAREPISQVALLVDGAPVAQLSGPPYRYDWDTSALAVGSHVLAAQAMEALGHTGAAEVAVDVKPVLAVGLSSPADGSDVVGVVDVQPDIQAVRRLKQVAVLVDGSPVATVPAPPYTYRWDTAPLPPGPHQLMVDVEDEQGAKAQAQAQVNVQPVLTVTWVAPQSSATLTETVPLLAQAQGHYGVDRVEFYANNQLLGMVREQPYQLDWPTLGLEEGSYKLSACAYDLMGHEECSELSLELKRPGMGLGLTLSLVALFVVIVGVVVMVVRSRQAAVRAPAPAAPPAVGVGVGPAPGPPPGEELRETAVGQPVVGAGEAPRARLVMQPKEGGAAREVALKAGETTIGRATGNDIHVDDELASRRHAVVRYEEDRGGYVFHDLNPTNPSSINGQECTGPHRLRPGDTILVGDTLLTFDQETQ